MLRHTFPALRRLARFCKDNRATLAVEAVLAVPFLAWCYLGMFTMFDGFRMLNANTTATFALSDLLSRETNPVTQAYMNGLRTVHGTMTFTEGTQLRVTVMRYDLDSNSLEFLWSAATGNKQPLTVDTMDVAASHVPPLADAESVIILESWMPFLPATGLWLEPFEFHQLVINRPRFAPQLLWQNG